MKEINELNKDIYNELIKNVDIKDIFLKELILSDIEFMPPEGPLSCQVNLKYECNDYKINTNIIEFYPKFELKLIIENIKPLTIKFSYRVQYIIKDLNKYPEEYIKFFMNRNIPVNIWPYARETISSITNKIGYPTINIKPYRG